MTDREEALQYLLSKLRCDDGWSGVNLAWNDEKMAIISDRFSGMDGAAKAKILLSFLGMTPRTVMQIPGTKVAYRLNDEGCFILDVSQADHSDECLDVLKCEKFESYRNLDSKMCSKEMQHILRLARRDGDEWVRVLACILAPFPTSQSITLEQCPEASLQDTLGEIGNALAENPQHFVPQQYAYLNAAVLHTTYHYEPGDSHDHFVLKKQPQGALQLRSDILQRAGTDFSQTGSLVKDRHQMQRQSSVTVPFVSSTRSVPVAARKVPIPGGPARVQRERGTKLLDIDEVPISTKRKRKLTVDGEVPGTSRTDVKKAPQKPTTKPEGELVPQPSSMMAPTPDYVAALGSEYGTGPRPLAYQDVPPGYNPQSVAMDTALTPLKIPDVPLLHTSVPAEPAATPTATPSAAIPAAVKQPTKGLRLTRQQLVIAQEMFKESPSLSREEKTLILGFMAGSRENPYPGHEVLTIKLNEKHETEEVTTPSGAPSTRKVLLETVFEMDYSSGRWRKLQYKKTLPQES